MGLLTRDQWARSLLSWMKLPVSERNLIALVAWQAAEGSPQSPQAKFNPLNTTRRMPGPPASTSFNSVGVQNYPTHAIGVSATVLTLGEKGHGYGAIVRHLKENDPPRETLAAVERSDWGTGGLARSIVDDVRADYDGYGEQPIGQ